jgi:hypothetical protein
VEFPAGFDEILLFSGGSHRNILTEEGRGKVKASVLEDRLTNASKPLQLYISLQVGSHCAYSVASPAHDASP